MADRQRRWFPDIFCMDTLRRGVDYTDIRIDIPANGFSQGESLLRLQCGVNEMLSNA